jgi:hypothetical protein
MVKTVIEMDSEDLRKAIEEVNREINSKLIYSKFNNRLISSRAVCEILGISYPTLQRYIKEGRVRQAESSHKFDLPYILGIDIKKHKHHDTTSSF